MNLDIEDLTRTNVDLVAKAAAILQSAEMRELIASLATAQRINDDAGAWGSPSARAVENTLSYLQSAKYAAGIRP